MIRKRYFLVALASVALLVTACAPYEHKAPIEEGPSTAQSATAMITGTVTVKSRTGEVRKGSDSTVYLIPVTAYSTEWFQHYVVNGEKVNGKDPRSFGSTRAAATDADGRFEFRAVASGEYFLTGTVQYQRPGFRIGRLNVGLRSLERIEAYARVKVAPNQQVEVEVTYPPA